MTITVTGDSFGNEEEAYRSYSPSDENNESSHIENVDAW
jgi:hypothetical protein